GAHGRYDQWAAGSFLAVALVVLVEQRERAFAGRSRGGEFRGQTLVGAPEFVIPLCRHWAALVNCRPDDLVVVGHLPEHLTIGGFLHILVGEARDLLVTVEHDPQAIAARSFLQERL